jgi:hypothetical protein
MKGEPQAMANQHADLIEHYARGGEKLSLAIRGLTRDDLLQAPPADKPDLGKWTIQQVVCHLQDSEIVYTDRIKRIIAEDNPTLLAYDENLWAKNLRYEDQSAEDAVALVEIARRQLGRTLAKLSNDGFGRTGNHSETGRKTLLDLIAGANKHLDHHLKFIHAKRAAMGKEMW